MLRAFIVKGNAGSSLSEGLVEFAILFQTAQPELQETCRFF